MTGYLACLLCSAAGAFTERFVLEDRNVAAVRIGSPAGKIPDALKQIELDFFKMLTGNDSGILVFLDGQDNKKNDGVLLSIMTPEYINETKIITFSDFISYDILEQQVKVSVEIAVSDMEGNLLWRRKASRYNYQRWMDFSRPVIGINPVVEYFFLPSQFVSSMKKQYSDEELINRTLTEVVRDLSENLVRIKN